jgi:TRAP transporter TAXI family solute receptor
VVAALVAAVAVVGLTWSQRDPQPRIDRLVVATGVDGGVYHTYGQAIGAAAREAFPGAAVDVRDTAGSVQNLRMIADGQADLAFTLADSAAAAIRGDPPFTAAPLPLAAVARLYDNYMHLVVLDESPVQDIAGLRGLRVSTGLEKSGTAVIADRLLELAGLQPDVDIDRKQLDLEGSVKALSERKIDAFFFSGGLPTQAIKELAGGAQSIRLIDLAEHVDGLRKRHGEFYAERTIPASTYGLPSEVATVGVPTLLVVPTAMPDATAHALTCLLFTAKDKLEQAHHEGQRLNRRAAIATYPVPLHRGAQRCYREAKP